MAALTLKENMDFDGEAIYQHVKNYLPSYARPRFIRIQVDSVFLTVCEKLEPLTKNTLNVFWGVLYGFVLFFEPLAGSHGGDWDL